MKNFISNLLFLFLISFYFTDSYPGSDDSKISKELKIVEPDSAKNKIVVALDNYYNNEWKENKNGEKYRYHYLWEDTAQSGFSRFGSYFKMNGADLKTLREAPAKNNLENFNVYIIVDPDTPKETENPNYIDEDAVEAITNWVKDGGFFMIMANDSGNCEFNHLNNLLGKFGFHFNEVSLNRVEGKKYEMGQFIDLPSHPVFEDVDKIYMKEISTVSVNEPDEIILEKDGKAAIAFKKFGKGYVMAIGDPWLYNEYIEHLKLPQDFQNYKAADNLCRWIISKIKER